MKSSHPFLGILCWEGGSNPKGLDQLESLKGNSTNPKTYPFPVLLKRVVGANYQSVVVSHEDSLISPMVEAAEAMIAQGVKAIITSCGFNAIFQRELASALSVPVFSSALMQIPLIRTSLGRKKILIITASKKDLTPDHFHAIGVTNMSGIEIYGMDEMPEWGEISRSPDQPLSIEKVEKEVISLALLAKEMHVDAGAVLLECTDLPPFANAVRQAVNLPVYDLSTMVALIRNSFST